MKKIKDKLKLLMSYKNYKVMMAFQELLKVNKYRKNILRKVKRRKKINTQKKVMKMILKKV